MLTRCIGLGVLAAALVSLLPGELLVAEAKAAADTAALVMVVMDP
jgi:hypothetical protein